MKLNVKGFTLSCGIMGAIFIAFLTLLSLLRGSGLTLGKLVVVFPGYSVSIAGIVIGLIYGFIYSAIAGLVFSLLYNALSRE